jgi:curved DNA-binding protein CbpA
MLNAPSLDECLNRASHQSDFYHRLGLAPDVDQSLIHPAYIRIGLVLMRAEREDVRNSEKCEEARVLIEEAYETLKTAEGRASYDRRNSIDLRYSQLVAPGTDNLPLFGLILPDQVNLTKQVAPELPAAEYVYTATKFTETLKSVRSGSRGKTSSEQQDSLMSIFSQMLSDRAGANPDPFKDLTRPKIPVSPGDLLPPNSTRMV